MVTLIKCLFSLYRNEHRTLVFLSTGFSYCDTIINFNFFYSYSFCQCFSVLPITFRFTAHLVVAACVRGRVEIPPLTPCIDVLRGERTIPECVGLLLDGTLHPPQCPAGAGTILLTALIVQILRVYAYSTRNLYCQIWFSFKILFTDATPYVFPHKF